MHRRPINRRLVSSFLLAAFTAVMLGVPVAAQRNSKDGAGLTVPFSAIGVNNGGTADVTGTFTITKFAQQNGQRVAIGTLAASVLDGKSVRTVITQATLPVSITPGASASQGLIVQQVACGILHLELGPLDLDLLGLVVHLDRVVLDISAEPGAGNLLGNLLCSVANLLNGGSPLAQILDQLVTLLNGIIAAL
jgi:hypothetical protein